MNSREEIEENKSSKTVENLRAEWQNGARSTLRG